MDSTTLLALQAIDRANDRDEAHENACEAYHAIEALQRCDTWMDLPLSVRRLLSASHAALGAIATGLAGE
jgi:hypothetical protein